MIASFYDVLDVDRAASADEIRAAWKSAIADLDPSDRRFRALSQAAEVLLDPERRAAHDADLAAQDAADQTPADAPAPAAPLPVLPETHVEPGRKQRREKRDDEADTGGTTRTPYAGWAPPVWLLAGVFVVVAALVALSAWQLAKPSDASVEASTRAAQSAAEKASVAVLSYDYRDLDANETAASRYLTPSFRKDYDKLFSLIRDNAESVKPVVTATVVASGVQRVNAAGDRVAVLVFVNRPSTNAETTTPKVYQDPVIMQMQRVDGDWLVDDMVTTPAS